MTDRFAARCLMVVMLALTALLFQVWGGGGIDETGYQLWLSSALFDGDLDQADDLLDSGLDPEFIVHDFRNITETGFFPNQFSLGPALIRAPVVAPAALTWRLANALRGLGNPDPLSFLIRALVSLVTLGLSAHALLLLYHTLRRFYSPGVSAAAAIFALLASPALVYIFMLPAMAHALALWAMVLIWHLSLRLWDEGSESALSQAWALGLAVGLLALIRWQAIVWAALPAAIWISQILIGPRRLRALLAASVAAVASILVFSIQMVAWHAIFGRWLLIPQGESFLASDEHGIALMEVLFAPWNGLLFSHPWLVLGLVGIPLWASRAPAPACGAAIGLLLTWFVNASVEDWWGGTAFGARRWVHSMPLMAFGMGALLNALPAGRVRRGIGISSVGGFTLINLFLAVQWNRGAIRQDWWGQWPLLWDAFASALTHPLEWIPSTWWDSALGRPENWPFATLLLLASLLSVGFAGLWSWRGSAPWPKRRAAAWATWAMTAAVALSLGLVGVLSTRSRHTEQHLMVREALLSSWGLRERWNAVHEDSFIFDPECPVHVATLANLSTLMEEEEEGLSLFSELEQDHPRFVGIRVLQIVSTLEARRHALEILTRRPRLQDGLLQAHVIGNASLLSHDSFAQFIRSAAASRDAHIAGQATIARAQGDLPAEARAFRRIQHRNPGDGQVAIRLMEISTLQGDDTEASRQRERALLWSEQRLRGFERLAHLSSLGVARNLSVEVADVGRTRLSIIDPVNRWDEFESVCARLDALIQKRRAWDDIVQLRLNLILMAARETDDTDALERFHDAIFEDLCANLDSRDAYVRFVEIQIIRGNWLRACHGIAPGQERFPDETDWVGLTQQACDTLDAQGVQTVNIREIPEMIWSMVAMSLRNRAITLDLPEVADRWQRFAMDHIDAAQDTDHMLERHFVLTWVRAREAGSDAQRRLYLSALEAHAESHPEASDSHLALAEIHSTLGEWREATEAIATGARLAPDGSDWLIAAATIARGLDADALASAADSDLGDLSPEVRRFALAGFAHRAAELKEYDLAHALWNRTIEAGFDDPRIVEYLAALDFLRRE